MVDTVAQTIVSLKDRLIRSLLPRSRGAVPKGIEFALKWVSTCPPLLGMFCLGVLMVQSIKDLTQDEKRNLLFEDLSSTLRICLEGISHANDRTNLVAIKTLERQLKIAASIMREIKKTE